MEHIFCRQMDILRRLSRECGPVLYASNVEIVEEKKNWGGKKLSIVLVQKKTYLKIHARWVLSRTDKSFSVLYFHYVILYLVSVSALSIFNLYHVSAIAALTYSCRLLSAISITFPFWFQQ